MRDRRNWSGRNRGCCSVESLRVTDITTDERTVFGSRLLCRTGPAGLNGSANAATGPELATNHRPHRIGSLDHVFQDLVHDIFLKNAKVAVTEEILLQRLQFQAAFARHVANGEYAEVRQPGFGAHRGQFGVIDKDFVAGELVFPGFDGRKGKVEAD